jgi:hypothetical protein
MVRTIDVWSENLIRDLALKQRLGVKADLVDELVAVVDHALEKSKESEGGVGAQDDEVKKRYYRKVINREVLKVYLNSLQEPILRLWNLQLQRHVVVGLIVLSK